MTLRISVFATFLFLSISPGLCMAKSDVVKMTDPSKTHSLFKKALNERNIDQLLALYADDCVMVLGNGQEIQDSESARKIFETWVNGVVEFDIETVFSVRSGDIALFRSRYHSVYKDAEGIEREYVSSGIEVVQQQKDGIWLIVLDHHQGGKNIPMAISDNQLNLN